MNRVSTANYRAVYDKLSPWEKTQVQPMPGGQSMVQYLAPNSLSGGWTHTGSAISTVPEHMAPCDGVIGMEPSDCSMYIPGCIPLWHWI